MSDQPAQSAMQRTPAQIENEYSRTCVQAGEKQFNKAIIEAELQQMNQTLAQLRNEYNEALKAQEKASKKKSSASESEDSSKTTDTGSTSTADNSQPAITAPAEVTQNETNDEPSTSVSS